MKIKLKPEPKELKSVAHSLTLDLRPIGHPVLGPREVQRGVRVHGDTDERLLLMAHTALCGMLGYREGGMSAYAALAAEVINQMPDDYRRLAVNLIITGDSMGLRLEGYGGGAGVRLAVERVRKYDGLVEPLATQQISSKLWTPGS